MDSIIFSTTGLVHLVFSILAMISGAWIVLTKKGTKLHKQIGYFYTINMVGLIITAFMIYRLFNGWGIFHYFALLSTFTLIAGMVPVIFRWPTTSWFSLHSSFMYWSVAGLYAAFISELFTRAPWANMSLFGIALFIFFGLASYYFRIYEKRWKSQFSGIS